jgi:hypothetical protein
MEALRRIEGELEGLVVSLASSGISAVDGQLVGGVVVDLYVELGGVVRGLVEEEPVMEDGASGTCMRAR